MTGVTIRFGVLGCADIALRRTLPALRQVSGAEVTAIASRDPLRSAQVAGEYGAAALADYDALLGRPDIDAVYIPLPTGLHREWVAAALSAGKHVLVEKPAATCYEDAAALVTLARERGLVLMENLTFPHHRVHRVVQRHLDEGLIGDLRVLHADFAFPPLPSTDFRYNRELGGGALLDAGVYPVRAARMFLGEELTVVGATLDGDSPDGVDLSGSVLLSARGGRTAHLTFGFRHAYRCSYGLWGRLGRLVVDRAFTPPPLLRPPIRCEEPDGSRYLNGPADDQFRAALAAFVSARDTPAEAVALGDDLLRQARLVDDIASAARSGDRRLCP